MSGHYADTEKWLKQAKDTAAMDTGRAAVMAQIAQVEAMLFVAERLREIQMLLTHRLR